MRGRAGLVTGAAGGIGRASAIAFAAAGAAVVVSDLQQQREGAEETVALIAREGGEAAFVACDVSVPAECQALVDATVQAYGRLDFAHNNAGIDHSAPLAQTEDADFRVNAICPAAVRTGITDKLPKEIHDMLPELQAIKRYAEPEEIAAAVVWLCSDAASFVTGVAMPIDGGATA
jgi:NAD(P)-dependent dehydrogenase (short-subunit alcohol dehydrogenase family)